MSIFQQLLLRKRDAEPVSLHQAEHAHRLCQDRVAVVHDARLAEGACSHDAVRAPGLMISIRSSNQYTWTEAFVSS